MNPYGRGFAYADQAAAEHAASEYRGIIIDLVGMLTGLAVDIDSLKLANVAEQFKAKISDINF